MKQVTKPIQDLSTAKPANAFEVHYVSEFRIQFLCQQFESTVTQFTASDCIDDLQRNEKIMSII